ncbi:MAG: hypothetical protein GC171_00855 [Terrimonas sp.]|nr:hypothetical protein [Terrimonas sp.]
MKKLLLIIPFFMLATGCKKTAEKVSDDLIVQAMTSGQWVMTSFIDNGIDRTSDFSAYKFQFYSNKTVSAIRNGAVENTGTWDGSTATQSIWAGFTGASNPINLISGTWVITNNSWTFVEARKTEGADVKTLRLDKL